jgi:peptidoglycan glycosyltransferase
VDKQTRRLGLAFLVLFLLLFVQVNYLQVFAADELANDPANHRLILSEYDVLRGTIFARDRQTVLAESVPSPGPYKYLRRYPHGSLYAQLTGYYSLIYGRSGLESAYNDYLSGRASALIPQNLVDEILGRPKRGANVITTLEPLLQRTASQALGSQAGAVVAMDPRTGEVLAMVSNPSFDPNPLASHDATVEQAAWKRILANPGKPLISKASQELYPPGSTFKVVTASADLQRGATPVTTYPNPHQLDLPQTTNTLKNFGDEWCLNGAPQITLDQALTVSCNVTFGQIGLDLQGGSLVGQAKAYGFDRQIPFDLPFAEGTIPSADTFKENQPLLAYSAIGQASVAANPLQMALIVSAIANGGLEMAPRLVTEIRDASGRAVRTFGPAEVGRPISQTTAGQLTAMMVNVVDHGTGTAAQIPGVQVAGKTGTAQHGGSGNPHAWFVAFAPAAHPTIAVAVVVLDGGNLGSEATGGRVAAPIARAVIEAALGRH